MKLPSSIAVLTLGIAVSLATPLGAAGQALKPDAEGFLIARPGDQHPAEGERRVNLIGDPNQEGLYLIQLTWAPGAGSRPHYHNQARYIRVLKGTWYVSTGAASDVYDPDSMVPVEAGTFIYEPPNGHHYDMAKDEEVIVEIWGMGPVNSTQIPQPGDAAGN